MTNDENRGGVSKPFDLEERTSVFGEAVIDFLKKVPMNSITNRLIDQLVGSGTSIGANYCEADDAVSKKDFRHKISICERESRESKFFIRMIVRAIPELRDDAKPLWQLGTSSLGTYQGTPETYWRHWSSCSCVRLFSRVISCCKICPATLT